MDKGWKVEGISFLVFEKKLLNVLVPSPTPSTSHKFISPPPSRHELCVLLPADVTLQRLASVLAGYGVELRQLTPEQLSSLSTLLQLLPKGSGRNLGECPGRETSNYQLRDGVLPPSLKTTWSSLEGNGQGQGREFF